MGNQLIREQIIEILESDYCDGGPTIGSIADKIEHLVNLEVEKRIKERMPSEEDVEINLASFDEITNDWFDFTHAVYHWLRSRLTSSEKPNNSPNDSQKQTHQDAPQVPYKTEGGGE